MAIEWMVVDNQLGQKQYPKWMRRVAFDNETEQVFLPTSYISGDAEQICSCALFDGAAIINNNGHFYIDCDWVVSEYPELKPFAALIQTKIEALLSSLAVDKLSCGSPRGKQ